MVDFTGPPGCRDLLFAFVVLAPVGEETLFRGFLYKGIAASRAGPIGAIMVSSLVFALLHVNMIGTGSSRSPRPDFTWARSAC